LAHRVDGRLDGAVSPCELAAEELVVLVRTGLADVDVLEPVREGPRIARAEAERCLALGLEVSEELRVCVPIRGRLHTGRLELVRSEPHGALAVELDHDRVLRAIDLANLEDARRIVRLEAVHVDTEVSDLLERTLPRELTQEADARDDRDVRGVSARDARLERGRVVRT